MAAFNKIRIDGSNLIIFLQLMVFNVAKLDASSSSSSSSPPPLSPPFTTSLTASYLNASKSSLKSHSSSPPPYSKPQYNFSSPSPSFSSLPFLVPKQFGHLFPMEQEAQSNTLEANLRDGQSHLLTVKRRGKEVSLFLDGCLATKGW